MAEVNGESGFTQLDKLNVREKLLIGGVEAFATEGYEQELQLRDDTTQVGQQGAVTVITFGSTPVTSPDGLFEYDGAGVFKILKSGPVCTKNRFRVGRAGASGVSNVLFTAQVSVDQGGSWLPFPGGLTVDYLLDNSNTLHIFLDLAFFDLTPGVWFRQVFSRSSVDNDSGDLIPFVPDAADKLLGFDDVPSAQIVVYKVQGFDYK